MADDDIVFAELSIQTIQEIYADDWYAKHPEWWKEDSNDG